MDTLQTVHMLMPERPLLGAMVLATCLVGGTATQNMAGTPHPVGSVHFAPAWANGAPVDRIADPATTLSGVRREFTSQPQLASKPRTSNITQTAIGLATPTMRSKTIHPAFESHPATSVGLVPVAPLATTVEPATPPVALVAVETPKQQPLSAPPALTIPTAVTETPVQLAASVSPVHAAPASPVVRTLSEAPVAAAPAVEPLKLISTPELRRFDLARFKPAVERKPARLAASNATKATPASLSAKARDKLVDGVIFHQTSITVAGEQSGKIAVRIGPDAKPSVKVADLLGLVSARMDQDALARFSMAGAANEYVSFATLRNAGFEVNYNAAMDGIEITAGQ